MKLSKSLFAEDRRASFLLNTVAILALAAFVLLWITMGYDAIAPIDPYLEETQND